MSANDIDIGWTNYSAEERIHILSVLQRDVQLRRNELERIRRLRAELQFLRRKGALKSSSGGEDGGGGMTSTEASNNNSRCCARCLTGLGRIINRGALCKSCRQRVCKACREYQPGKSTSGGGGPDWVCTVCYKNASVEAASGEWMNAFIRRPSRRRCDSKDAVEPGEIVSRGIRRSWTFSNPSSSSGKEHQETAGTHHHQEEHHQHPGGTGVQIYHHHPPQQHQMRRPPPPSAMDGGADERTVANNQGQHRSSGLLWEPRDPPLVHQHHNFHHHHRHHHQQQHPGVVQQQSTEAAEGGGGKSRLQPRRSASLSQADLVAYDGKLVLNLSQSPHRTPFGAGDSGGGGTNATRYQDYYESKYAEKPIRMSRADAPGAPASRQSRTGPGVDVDTVWKSRWRSTSPPPAPVDDWLPIKPPQLAWAKTPSGPMLAPSLAVPPPPADIPHHHHHHHLPRRSKSSRIPSGAAGPSQLSRSMSQRSMSSEMDHMIYLERDVPLMRERTRSIDRGLAGGHQPGPHHHQPRATYKTYEEELADYHGRTGSVDRLASSSAHHQQHQRGRTRTNIRMGTQVGRSVPVSLERRDSELGMSSSVERTSSSSSRRNKQMAEDSSSSSNSGGRMRRGSSSVEISQSSSNEPSSAVRSSSAASNKNNNINRVYIDGQPDGPSAIRVTMTDTRSLRRPTNQQRSAGNNNNPPGSESSTMPRANSKRHGQVQVQPVRPTGIVQPQQQHRPGPTTVYLAAAPHDHHHHVQQEPSSSSSGIGFESIEGGVVFRKLTPQRNNNNKAADGQGESEEQDGGVGLKRISTRTVEKRVTHLREVRDVQISVSTQPTAEIAYPHRIVVDDDYEEDEEEEEECEMQDASVQTSDTGQDVQQPDTIGGLEDVTHPADSSHHVLEPSPLGHHHHNVAEKNGNSNESAKIPGTSGSAPSGGSPAAYHQNNSSDSASDNGGCILDSDKMHPEGDDYKIVFISSDSSKSGDSLEGSFDGADQQSTSARQMSGGTSLQDSESATGFIDENDWLFFASAGHPRMEEQAGRLAGSSSPRSTFLMDDFSYGWASDEGLSEIQQQHPVESKDCQIQTDLSSVDGDFEAEAFNAEYESISHFLRGGPPAAVPIWQVPASSRASTQSLLSEASSNWPAQLRDYFFNRSDSKRSSGERSMEELQFRDHIFSNSLYSPDGLALPGFQEYRDQILNEIQAYTQKGDWNLSASDSGGGMEQQGQVHHQKDSLPIRPPPPYHYHHQHHQSGAVSRPTTFLAGPLLGKINNLNYRIRPTYTRPARWRAPSQELSAPGAATGGTLSKSPAAAPPSDSSRQELADTAEPFHSAALRNNSKSTCLPPENLTLSSETSSSQKTCQDPSVVLHPPSSSIASQPGAIHSGHPGSPVLRDSTPTSGADALGEPLTAETQLPFSAPPSSQTGALESSPTWKSAVPDARPQSEIPAAAGSQAAAGDISSWTSSDAPEVGRPNLHPPASRTTNDEESRPPDQQGRMEDGDPQDDVMSHCCASQVAPMASCPEAPSQAGLDSPLPTLSPDPVATAAQVSPLLERAHHSRLTAQEEENEEIRDGNGGGSVTNAGRCLGAGDGLAGGSAPGGALTAHPEGQQPPPPLPPLPAVEDERATCSGDHPLPSSSSRFEVLAVQEGQIPPARPRRLLSDSDVPTSGDESSGGAGGGFDTDTQQETVHDLRQFALSKQKQQRSSPSVSAAADSDTDSSSSSHQKRSSGSVTASPVLSDGRSTPRRSNQAGHVSYVLIKPANTGGDQVIVSDDESGVTVILPTSRSSSETGGCVVEVPAAPASAPTANSWPEESDSETNEESASCVTVSGNGVLTDDFATSDDDTTTDQAVAAASGSKLARYFNELDAGFDPAARRQPVVHRNDPAERAVMHSPDPYEEEDVSLNSTEEQSVSLDQDTLQYESDPSESGSRLDSIDDGESFYSESGASSGDEVYMDQEEELRGYNRAIDFTLHTILEESCEESDGEKKSLSGDRSRNKETSELEKYFTQGLGAGGGGQEESKRRSYANEESEYSDTFSETSSSIYSEGMEPSGGEEEEVDPVDLASSRLEKYFRTNFLGLEGAQYPFPMGAGSRAELAPSSDGSESVGSDSEGHPSPEQQRRRKVMKARGMRQQATGPADWSRSSLVGSDLDEEGSLSTDPDSSAASNLPEQHRSSVSSTDESDEEDEEEEEIVMEKTDGEFDTIKRRKKKRSAGEQHVLVVTEQLPILEDQAQEAAAMTDAASPESPEREPSPAAADSPAALATEDAPTDGLDPNCPRKYQSRDSGFVGSCDDLLNDSQKELRQRRSSDSGSSNDGVADKQQAHPPMDGKHNKSPSSSSSPDSSSAAAAATASRKGPAEVKPDESDSKSGKSVGSSGSSGDHGGSLTSTSQSSKSGKLSRKDSFNNWSSDEETNLMVNKMRALFRNMVSGGAADGASGEKVKPPQLVVFETELTRLMKSVPGINDQQVKEIVEYLSSEDTWSDSYDSSDYTSSDLEAAGVALDHQSGLILPGADRSDLQQQISASCQEIIEKFDLDRSPDGSHLQINAVGSHGMPWLPVGEDASNSLNKETAFVYQRLVNSLMRLNSVPKAASATTTGDSQTANASAQPNDQQQPQQQPPAHQNSPPVIAKVLHHIGNRLVALMHEVSASSPDTTSHSGSLDEDAQSAGRLKELRLAAHFEPVTSSPRLPKGVGRLYANKDHFGAEDKRSLSTSIDSEDTPTDTEQSPDSDDSRTRKNKSGDVSGIKFGFESLHTYEKRMSSSLPPQLGAAGAEQQSRSLRTDGFSSLESAESRGIIGGSRSLKARLAERARTLEAERRRVAEEQESTNAAAASAQVTEEDPAEEDRFYKKARKLPRFSLFSRASGASSSSSANRDALQSSSSGVSDIAEEKEDDFSGWRSSFESAIAADSRTKLSLEAKRRSAGSASSSELFASTGELLDRDSSRHRVRSSGHSSKFSLPNLLERDAVRMARERERERSASSDVLLSTSPVASNPMLSSIADQQQGTEDEDGGWDRMVITRMSSKRRSSVPDTREERGSAEEPTRSTTLPRSTTALSAVENDLDLGSSSSPSISASTAGVKKSLSLLLSHSTTNSASESSLNTSVDTPVRSARYRPPGFRSSQAETTTPRAPPRTPQRAPSAPRLESVTPRSSGSAASSLSSRKNVRSMLADERGDPYSSSPSFVREGFRTSVASSAASGESFSSVSASDTLDDGELSASQANKSRSSSLSALGTRSDSMASVYSAGGEARYGTVAVRGEIQFGLHYNYRQTALEVFVKQCKDLAPVDTKRNRSDPYAKVYLLPDRSKSGKRKTKVKKHTLSPMFEENLKFTTSLSDLENRTLWLTVWHSDMFGRNDFLGEVTLPLAGRIFDDPTPHWYPLQERSEIAEETTATPTHRGDIIVALKYVPGESSPSKRTKKSKGSLHVIVKEAKGLIAARPNGNIDALCKGTLMPEKGKPTKHKTSICRRTSNPVWNNTFIFDDLTHQELRERALELDIWNHDRLATKEFLGGIRLNLGAGLYQGKPAEWMDATGKEVTLWSAVVERAGLWVEGSVPLRTSMERPLSD